MATVDGQPGSGSITKVPGSDDAIERLRKFTSPGASADYPEQADMLQDIRLALADAANSETAFNVSLKLANDRAVEIDELRRAVRELVNGHDCPVPFGEILARDCVRRAMGAE